MRKNLFEVSLQNEQRAKELRQLNNFLKTHSQNEIGTETPASAKLAEAIMRAQKAE